MNAHSEIDGWKEWSKHILLALERLDGEIGIIKNELNKANLDIAKLGFINNKIHDIDEQISLIRKDIVTQNELFKESIKSLEQDDRDCNEETGIHLSSISSRLDKLEKFDVKIQTISYIIGTILLAGIGLFSISIKFF